MADETTPLNPTIPPGPQYVFPGGVSPRSRRYKLRQLQCCISMSFIGIIFMALFIALLVNNLAYDNPQSGVFLVTNDDIPSDNDASGAPANKHQPLFGTAPIPDEPQLDWALKRYRLNQSDHDNAIGAGIKALGDKEILEESSQTTPTNSPAFRHYRSLSSNPESRKLSRRGYVENHATLRIAQLFNYTKQPGRSNIGRGPKISIPDPTLNFTCDFNSRYRTANGLCNNKLHPRFYGAALIPYRRMVAPDYADGISLPRTGSNGTALPSARDVSLKIHRASYDTDSNFTVMLAVFGQFLDHDITATSLTTSLEGESISCCTVPLNEHPECFPVPIDSDDPYYELYNLTCMNFVRSSPAPTGRFGPRQQLNQATSFIDGSVVYGNTEQRQKHLRTHTDGKLRMYVTEDGRELLPISTSTDDGCNQVRMSRQGKYCFESGDDRANENLLLTSMHMLFARHHNYLAGGLREANPDWEDEVVFQEARKILSAQMAHIAYNEFLPILLGRGLAAKKGLLPDVDDLEAPDTYDRKVDPSVANCFAGAAFRFAHTLLPGLFNLTRDKSNPESVELHRMLFNPFSLWSKRGIDNAVATAVNTPVLRVDRFFSVEITQKLFEGTAEDKIPICGLDLVSLNIQRGRDHGLPSYPVFRRHCQLPKVDTWEDMAKAIEPSSLKSIQEIYTSPHDVDVYTGALSEPPLEGAIFGPLLACLVSDQFMRLKRGDSHWYERKVGPQRFTKDQLREIYKTTLSAIICRNTDSLENTQLYVMEHHAMKSVDCDEIKNFNFTPWQMEAGVKSLPGAVITQQSSKVRVIRKEIDNATKASPATGEEEHP